MGFQTLFRLANQRFDHITGSHKGAGARRHHRHVLRQRVVDRFAQRRSGRYVAQRLLTRVHRLPAHPWGLHHPHHRMQPWRIAHEEGEQRLQRLEPSQRLGQRGGLADRGPRACSSTYAIVRRPPCACRLTWSNRP